MGGSPIGRVRFAALGGDWTLKFGMRQRFRIEQEFGIGFAAAVVNTFPSITPDAVDAGDLDAVRRAIKPEDVMLGSISMMFGCCLVERVTDDQVDAMIEELGYPHLCELLGEALTASLPEKGAAAEAAVGEAKAGKTRKT